MAKKFELNECSIISDVYTKMKDVYGMLIPDIMIGPIFRTVERSLATMLKYNESKTVKKMGFSIRDDKGEFVIGSILTYNPPEDEDSDDEGNYSCLRLSMRPICRTAICCWMIVLIPTRPSCRPCCSARPTLTVTTTALS